MDGNDTRRVARSTTHAPRRSHAWHAAWLALLLTGCSNVDGESPPPSDPVAVFFSHVHAADGAAWLEDNADAYAAGLSASDAQRLAARARADANAEVRLFAVRLLYARGDEAAAAEAAADLVLRGDDIKGLVWGWMHGSDPTVTERRMAAIRDAITRRAESLDPAQRARAIKAVCEHGEDCLPGSTRTPR